jgi:hypothetical protein
MKSLGFKTYATKTYATAAVFTTAFGACLAFATSAALAQASPEDGKVVRYEVKPSELKFTFAS